MRCLFVAWVSLHMLAAQAQSSVANTVTVTPPAGVALPGGALNRAATDTDAVLRHTKVVQAGPTPTANPNQYTATYRVRVENNGTLSASYGLIDSPLFAPGVTISAASTVNTGAGAPAGGSLAPSAGPYSLAASGTSIGPGVVHQFDVSITYTVGAVASADAACGAAGSSQGLRNRSSLTPTGGAVDVQEACTPIALADVSISKTGPANVAGGGSLSYTLVVSNAGPSAADGALLKDASVANFVASAVSCGSATGGAVCPGAGSTSVALLQGAGIVIPTLPSGGSLTFTVSGAASAAGSISNVASVSTPAGVSDSNPGNNSATANTTVIAAPTLSKAFAPATIAAGGVSTLTITLSNNNASAASLSAVLSDTLPAGVTVAATPNAATTCSGSGAVGATAGGGTVSLPATRSIPGGAPGTCTVTVDVTSATPGAVTNTIAAGGLQTSNGNNAAAASAALTVNANAVTGIVFNDVNGLTDNAVNGTGTNAASATLTVYLVRAGVVVASATVAADGTYQFANVLPGAYSLVLSNIAGLATGAPAPTPSLPAGWASTGEGLTAAGDGSPNGVIETVSVGAGGIANANFGIEQPPTAGGASAPAQPNPGGTNSVAVPASAFTTGSSDVAPGTVVTYTITAFPTGANSITIGATTYSASTFPAAGVSVAASAIGTAVSVDPLDGPVSVTIPFKVIDNAGLSSVNTGTATLPFSNAVADLILQKNGPASVAAGSVINYTLTVSNSGPSAVSGATVNDVVPAAVINLSVSCGGETAGASCGPSTSYSFNGNTLAATIATLPSGSSVSLTITGTVAASTSGTFTNTASVVAPSGVTDPNSSNNTSSVTTGIGVVSALADLSITKTGTSSVLTGGAITYQITAVNAGPGPADGAVISDNVPVAITGVTTSCTASGGATCPSAVAPGNAIAVTAARMPSGARVTLTVTGVAPASAQSIVNTASIAAPAGVTDPTLSNNSSSVTTTVTSSTPAVADLAVVKTGPASINAGGLVTYSVVVTNNGPAAADGASFVDPLPPVLSGATASCSASAGAVCGSVSVAAGVVSSQISTLPVGGRVVFTITATAPQGGAFSNSATITPPTGVNDPNTSNNAGGPVVTQVQNTGVAGFVWLDSNRNGVRDSGEALLPGVTVRIFNAAGQQLATTSTDVNGAYVFTGLPAGSGYRVVFDFGSLDRGIVVPQNSTAALNGT
ncbi:MAG: DUF11 domain-containing protein, partial [Betaproteobacteria bacterium]|nr:DUF11 domain-containing protein [Betaproteobacteria bacterium]